MTNKLPPTKETALQMARFHCDTTKNEKLMWEWLMVWVAYEDWRELYWGIT